MPNFPQSGKLTDKVTKLTFEWNRFGKRTSTIYESEYIFRKSHINR